jgi:hypothetical protein
MKRRELMIRGFVCFGLAVSSGFSISAQAENEYAYWSRFKAGTFVSFRCATTAAGKTTERPKTFKIKEVRPDAVIIDYFESPVSVAAKSASDPALSGGSRIEFRAVEYSGGDVLAGMLGINIEETLKDASGKRLESGPEDLAVKGKVLRATRTKILFGRPEARTTVTLWTCNGIPGKLVKFVREIEAGGVSYREENQAVDFLSLKADAGEIAKLKADRKSEVVEISGLNFIIRECRFLEDFDHVMSDWPALEAALSVIVPGNPNTDWTEANNKIFQFIEKIKNMKKHLEEDKGKAKNILSASDFNKINSFWPAASRFIGVFLDNHEFMAFAISLEPGDYIKTDFVALMEKLVSLRSEYDSARSQLMLEIKKIGGLKIKYIR